MSELPPFTLIDRHNIAAAQLPIRALLGRATHLSIDTEFSGLGDPRATRTANLEDRYVALSNVVKTHGLLSLGLTVFVNPSSSKTTENGSKDVHNFHFLLVPSVPFTMSPSSCAFLAGNGFDFNVQFRNGIVYEPGNDPSDEDATAKRHTPGAILRSLVTHILSLNKPIIVHNGLLDLMFIYQALYAELPKDLGTFVADMTELFPGGLYDTKYIADYVTREKASFLSYLYRKCERLHEAPDAKKLVCKVQKELKIMDSWAPSIIKTAQEMNNDDTKGRKKRWLDTGKPFCEQYAAHGFCRQGTSCLRSHDLDLILDFELAGTRKRGKTVNGSAGTADISTKIQEQTPIPTNPSTDAIAKPEIATTHTARLLTSGYHSACFDAYMTGFVFLSQLLLHPDIPSTSKNKLYVMGKPRPLLIEKSSFAKTSAGHESKKAKRRVE